jgi:hypothetical protein
MGVTMDSARLRQVGVDGIGKIGSPCPPSAPLLTGNYCVFRAGKPPVSFGLAVGLRTSQTRVNEGRLPTN